MTRGEDRAGSAASGGAEGAGDGWRWVVAPGVTPEPGARAAAEAARDLVPGVVVVAARVVLPGGVLDPGSAPWPDILDKEHAIATARAGLLAIRAAPPGALLVRDGVEPTLRGTAEALTDGRGVLAPQSVARRAKATRPPSARERVRLARAPFWTREERLWQAFLLTRRP